MELHANFLKERYVLQYYTFRLLEQGSIRIIVKDFSKHEELVSLLLIFDKELPTNHCNEIVFWADTDGDDLVWLSF